MGFCATCCAPLDAVARLTLREGEGVAEQQRKLM
eukprot:gene24509-44535_t